MKVLLLLLILPCLVLGEVCPGGTLTCPEGKICCKVNGEQSCCGRGKRTVLNGEEVIAKTGSYLNVSIVETKAQVQGNSWDCPGTMCPTGCCEELHNAVCCDPYCCPTGSSCCSDGCCGFGYYCTDDGCCPVGSRDCGLWCCPNFSKCGKNPHTCDSGSAVTPTVIVFLGIAAVMLGRKSLIF